MSQNLSSAAVVIGALRVRIIIYIFSDIFYIRFRMLSLGMVWWKFQRLVFKILENVQYDILADSDVDLPLCCHYETRTHKDKKLFLPVV